MKINLIFVPIFLILILFTNILIATDYDSTQTAESLISESVSEKSMSKTDSTSGDKNDDMTDDEEEDQCTGDQFYEIFTQKLLPDDYEEGKTLDFNRKIKHINETIAKLKRLDEYRKNVTERFEPTLKRLFSRFTEVLMTIELTPDCMVSLARIGKAVQERKAWGMKFIFSQPQMSTNGAMEVSNFPMGEYDTCLEIESLKKVDQPVIRGQYCSLSISSVLPVNPTDDYNTAYYTYISGIYDDYPNFKKFLQTNKLTKSMKNESRATEQLMYMAQHYQYDKIRGMSGLCIPTTCSAKEIEYALNRFLFPINRVAISVHPDCDYVGKKIQLDHFQIVSTVVFSLLFALVAISTVYNSLKEKSYISKNSSPMSRLLDCFSFFPNFNSLFSTEVSNEKFSAMDGVRGLLAWWMVIEHEYESGLLLFHQRGFWNSAAYRMTYDIRYVGLMNFNVTDTFFLMGGFMTTYVIYSKMEKSKGKFNYIHYAIYRYLRLLPIVVAAIFMTFLLPLIGDGPLWSWFNNFFTFPCETIWHQTVLMYQNYMFYPNVIGCVPVTWYTACDFQLYLLAPIAFVVLYHYPKFGMIWCFVLICFGAVLPLIPRFIWNIPHIFEFLQHITMESGVKAQWHFYWGIGSHISVYVVGIVLGYMVRYKPNLYLGGRIGEVFIWIITWASTIYGILWHKDYLKVGDYKIQPMETFYWIVFSKLAYIPGWCWLFYACSTGRGGFINRAFAWKGFKFFSNIMLEIYIIHLFVITYRIGITRHPVLYSDYDIWTYFVCDMFLISFASIIMSCFVTKPFAKLVNLLLLPPKRIQDNKENGIATNDAVTENIDIAIISDSINENELNTKKNIIDFNNNNENFVKLIQIKDTTKL